MKFITVSAAGVVVFVSCGSAFAWGSLETTGSNTHACLDRTAYAVLAQRPGFNGEVFPKEAAILAHEGVAQTAGHGPQGPGPDSDGATFFSEHYYNPLSDKGRAPTSINNWFVKLASRVDTAKAAAWSAHFLADIHVPYHINGIYGAEIKESYLHRADPRTFYLPDTAVGQREQLSRPLMRSLPIHSINWQIEASRYFAAEKDAPYLDWFDPWYWNGSGPGPAIYIASSHLSFEGVVHNCPSGTPRYSSLWPGNPKPTWDHAAHVMGDVVTKFAKRIATRTYNNTPEYVAKPDDALMESANSILTLWRASFSALRVSLTQDPDPAAQKSGTPSIAVRGRLENPSGETATGVEMKLAIRSGTCKRKEPELVKIGSVPPGGTKYYGYWHVSVPDAGNCQLRIGAIGKFSKTPDLQLDWHDDGITVKLQPAAVQPAKPQASKPSALDPCTCSFYIRKHPAECSDWMHRSSKGTYEEHEQACQKLEHASAAPSQPVDCLGADYGSDKCTAH